MFIVPPRFTLLSELFYETGAARPAILGAEHGHGDFGRIGIGRNAVIVKMLPPLLDLHVAREWSHDRLLDAFGLHFVHDLHHQMREHHGRRDDGVPIAQDQRVDARILQSQADGVLIGLGRLAAGDVDRVPRRAEGRNELAEGGVEIGRNLHQVEAVVDAGIGQQHARAAGAGYDHPVFALGRGQLLQSPRVVEHVTQARGADDARLPQDVVVDLVVARERAGVRTRRPCARRGAARLQHDDRLLLGDALRHFGEGAAVLQILEMHGDDLAVRVLLEEGQQVVFVEIGFVAQADDRRNAHLGRTREADDRHADAARLRAERGAALVVVGRAESGAEILRRVVVAVDVGAHQAGPVFAADRLDFLLAFDIAGFGEARRNQHRAGDFLLADLDQRLRYEFRRYAEHRDVDHAGHVLDALT